MTDMVQLLCYKSMTFRKQLCDTPVTPINDKYNLIENPIRTPFIKNVLKHYNLITNVLFEQIFSKKL